MGHGYGSPRASRAVSSTDGHGVAICETNDDKALHLRVARCADLIPMRVTPCLDDPDAGEVLGGMLGG